MYVEHEILESYKTQTIPAKQSFWLERSDKDILFCILMVEIYALNSLIFQKLTHK